MELFLKIALAAVLLMLAWRLWPAAKHWMEHGPKGSGDDWKSFVIAIAGVVGFVILLIALVRG